MNDVRFVLAQNYRGRFATTSMLEQDLKMVKKLNTLFNKLERSDKDAYMHEIVNTLRILGNTFYIDGIAIVLYENVDVKYHDTLDFVMKEIFSKR